LGEGVGLACRSNYGSEQTPCDLAPA
jgi:hypothetical protein